MKDLARFQAAMEAYRDWQPPPLQFGFAEFWTMIANLQLAMRHPANVGQSAQTARGICDALIATLPSEDLRDLARLGYHPEHDL